MRGQLYRNCYIFSLAQLHSVGWLPSVRIKWLQEGKEQQIDLKMTETFTAREKAEECGLAIGRSWVDKQITQGKIGG